MRYALSLLALVPTVTEAKSEPAHCRPGADRVRVEPTGPTRARPLNEMPDARPVLTVLREVDGCRVLLVRDGGRIVEEPVGRPERRRVFRP